MCSACAPRRAGSLLSLCGKLFSSTVYFFQKIPICAKFHALSHGSIHFWETMGKFFKKSIFQNVSLAASPILKIQCCNLKKTFWARQEDSNGILNVSIGPLYAEIQFSSTRLRQRFLPPGYRCGIPHSLHRFRHAWGQLLSTSCIWAVPGVFHSSQRTPRMSSHNAPLIRLPTVSLLSPTFSRGRLY